MKKKSVQIEVVDKNDRPITHMDLNEVHRQSLRHRSVTILVYDNDGKLFLQKRSSDKKLYAGRWDVSARGHVLANESREQAAIRELEYELGIRNATPKLLDTINASAETGYEFITVYNLEKQNSLPDPNPDEVESGYFYSESELDWLIREYRDLLAPALVFLHDCKLLFKKR